MLLSLAFFASPAFAVNIYRCQDSQGNISYQDHCPPGSTVTEEKQYSTATSGSGSAQPTATGPLTLYVVPDCDSCKQVEDFLAARGIPVTEKNVNKNIDLQKELKKAAGDLRVPALMVGDQAIIGYNRSQLLDALSKAGYNTNVKTGSK
ncbi:MAG: glutaredoxin family protein [Gammaproteobacteria bacterium]